MSIDTVAHDPSVRLADCRQCLHLSASPRTKLQFVVGMMRKMRAMVRKNYPGVVDEITYVMIP